MNDMCVLAVKNAASGDGVHCTFVDDKSLSKHLIYATVMKGSNFASLAPML